MTAREQLLGESRGHPCFPVLQRASPTWGGTILSDADSGERGELWIAKQTRESVMMKRWEDDSSDSMAMQDDAQQVRSS